jgi:ABC-type multidrug transport system ATPase subunit
VFLDDIDVLDEKDEVRRLLGYLPQDFGVYPKVTAYELLDHFAQLKGLSNRARRREIVDGLLQQTNLFEVRHQRMGGFSGGMRQRFGIAQALLGDPQLIIVDEPTAGLDPQERVRFHNLLSDIGQDKTVILSTHIVSDVADLCANMAIINKGQVLLCGEPQKLIYDIEDSIWARFVTKQELPLLQREHEVISTRLLMGRTLVHVYSERDPGDGFEPTAASLEDVYFATIAGHYRPEEGDD